MSNLWLDGAAPAQKALERWRQATTLARYQNLSFLYGMSTRSATDDHVFHSVEAPKSSQDQTKWKANRAASGLRYMKASSLSGISSGTNCSYPPAITLDSYSESLRQFVQQNRAELNLRTLLFTPSPDRARSELIFEGLFEDHQIKVVNLAA
jgi:hypothetical protein